MQISVIIPARNEADNLPIVIADLRALDLALSDSLTIIVCDNGSTDDTANIAIELGATVTNESQAGYGAACLSAMSILQRPDIVVFVDADQRVPGDEWQQLLGAVIDGADLAIGCRSKTEKSAMTLQQSWGNRFATGIIRSLFGYPITDLGPFRAIEYKKLLMLDMRDRAYGWTVEMQLKAYLLGIHVVEVPVTARKRLHGKSTISGTLRGTIGAGSGILGTILKSTCWSIKRKRRTL